MIWTALLLGFAGSIHCIGMCSPLLALVSSSRSLPRRVVYNLGRLIPYAILGGLAGAFGFFVHFSALQFWVALGLGLLLIFFGVTGRSFKLPLVVPFISKLISKIKALFSAYRSSKNLFFIFFLGTLNGFIPCGLTYIAASYCILLPGTLDGILFMVAFGLGTIPAMIVSPWVISQLAIRFSVNSKKIMAAAVIVLGCSIIARAAFISYKAPQKGNDSFSICNYLPAHTSVLR